MQIFQNTCRKSALKGAVFAFPIYSPVFAPCIKHRYIKNHLPLPLGKMSRITLRLRFFLQGESHITSHSMSVAPADLISAAFASSSNCVRLTSSSKQYITARIFFALSVTIVRVESDMDEPKMPSSSARTSIFSISKNLFRFRYSLLPARLFAE